jgi:glutaconate CoA-transferase subunit B
MVITDMGILEAVAETGELELTALYPGVTVEAFSQGVGWPLRVRSSLRDVAPPTVQDLHLLRHTLDPRKLFLK